MKNDLPTGKLGRGLTGGRTAVKLGAKMLGYYAKRPFLSCEERLKAKEKAAMEGAAALYQGLSLLKGTALKMAQQLSLELDVLPDSACRELSKAYHQVPPINRALVRKVVQAALGRTLEEAFTRFETKAFAAASLGQVHRAADAAGQPLAVKIQYPGIAKTIETDVSLLRHLLGPMFQSEQLVPTLDEIAARLREEVDYRMEAGNLCYFADHLKAEAVCIPHFLPGLSGSTVLTTSLMPGRPLDVWLKGNPAQQAKDHIAAVLNRMVVNGLYELHAIHADPNPGNFIIADDLTVGLVDFGCVKRLPPAFVEQYRKLTLASAHQDKDGNFQLMIEMGLIPPDLDTPTRAKVREFADAMGRWFGQLFQEEIFDFRAHPHMMGEGKAIMRRFQHLRHHLTVNPDFIFLDRTRYGLLRIFEMLGARVNFRNSYEW
jgi:predicted unusual protein kinase regulating ubiquinone biosynthesis (AarF/ABC1/UbiB family)